MNHIFRDGEGVIHDQCQRCGAAQIDQADCLVPIVVPDSDLSLISFNPLNHEQSK